MTTRPSPAQPTICFCYVNLYMVECSVFGGIKRVWVVQNETFLLLLTQESSTLCVHVSLCGCISVFINCMDAFECFFFSWLRHFGWLWEWRRDPICHMYYYWCFRLWYSCLFFFTPLSTLMVASFFSSFLFFFVFSSLCSEVIAGRVWRWAGVETQESVFPIWCSLCREVYPLF